MRVIYTSKVMPKKFGVRVIHSVRVIYRKIRYLSNSCHNNTHYITILKSSYKIATVFEHVLVAATTVSRARSLYKLKNCDIKTVFIIRMNLEPSCIIYQRRAW
jgi:hypothetical protein